MQQCEGWGKHVHGVDVLGYPARALAGQNLKMRFERHCRAVLRLGKAVLLAGIEYGVQESDVYGSEAGESTL